MCVSHNSNFSCHSSCLFALYNVLHEKSKPTQLFFGCACRRPILLLSGTLLINNHIPTENFLHFRFPRFLGRRNTGVPFRICDCDVLLKHDENKGGLQTISLKSPSFRLTFNKKPKTETFFCKPRACHRVSQKKTHTQTRPDIIPSESQGTTDSPLKGAELGNFEPNKLCSRDGPVSPEGNNKQLVWQRDIRIQPKKAGVSVSSWWLQPTYLTNAEVKMDHFPKLL